MIQLWRWDKVLTDKFKRSAPLNWFSQKESTCNAGDARDGVWSLGREDPLEKEKTTHSGILAWKIPRTEGPGGLPSIASQRVGHNWSNLVCTTKPALQEMLMELLHTEKKCQNDERKNLIGKGKYTIKVLDQTLTKLVGRLKDKSRKIIYIHHK